MMMNNNMMAGLQLLRAVSDINKKGGLFGNQPKQEGIIPQLMSDNPGGLLGAIMGKGNAPMNPGSPPPPGDPAYVEGGQGPMQGGGPGGMTLGQMLPKMGLLGGMGGGGMMPNIGGLGGW